MANDTDMQAVILRLLLGLWDNDSLAVVLIYKKKKKKGLAVTSMGYW